MPTNIERFFAEMWQDYLPYAPSSHAIHELLGKGETIINDHVALRSFDRPGMGVDALGQHLLAMGYEVGGEYAFTAKKLRAKHYQHADPKVPKVFISELILEECSESLNAIVNGLLDQVDLSIFENPNVLYSGRHWSVSYADYQRLLQESEYAAWLAAFGYRANHFTVDVNQLPGFERLQDVNTALKQAGFVLNSSGGEIKGSPEVLLEQSSTMADKVSVPFSDGEFTIPACFYEFALRYTQANGELYHGFVEASADKIFESTNAA